MDWSDWRSSAGLAANITSLALRFADTFKGKPTPELHVVVQPTGGGTGVDFSVYVSEVANIVPAMGVHVYAEIEGEGEVFAAPPFNLPAGELDRFIHVSLERPKYGTLVKECNDQQTLYGRKLTVTVVSDDGGVASAEWLEDLHEPGSARYEVMQRVWARKGEPPLPGSHEDILKRHKEKLEQPNRPDSSRLDGRG